MNVREALQAAFGPDAMDHIDTTRVTPWLDWEVHPLRLCTASGDSERGAIFIYCGGEAFAHLRPVATNTSARFYLVWDDSDATPWEDWRQQYRDGAVPFDSGKFHTPRPKARLRLVASA